MRRARTYFGWSVLGLGFVVACEGRAREESVGGVRREVWYGGRAEGGNEPV